VQKMRQEKGQGKTTNLWEKNKFCEQFWSRGSEKNSKGGLNKRLRVVWSGLTTGEGQVLKILTEGQKKNDFIPPKRAKKNGCGGGGGTIGFFGR